MAEGKDEKQIKKYFAAEPDVWADINLKKIEVYYYTKDTNDRFFAVRTALGEVFTADYIRNKVTDGGIQKILLAHLERCGGDPKLAFSPDGIEQMNADIQMLNNGVPHKPIKKVRVYEKAEKFAVGQIGSKSKKFVEADKGTLLYFAIYRCRTNETERRTFVSVPLQTVVDCQKKDYRNWRRELDSWIRANNTIAESMDLYCTLSPGDLVYMPTKEEVITGVYKWDRTNIYKVVSFTGPNCYFIPQNIASPIIDKVEFTQLNKVARTNDDRLIREYCILLKTNRLGKITEVYD